MFQEFPKMLFGPAGETTVVEDAEQEAEWLAQFADDEDEGEEVAAPVRRRGRPPKVR